MRLLFSSPFAAASLLAVACTGTPAITTEPTEPTASAAPATPAPTPATTQVPATPTNAPTAYPTGRR